MWADSSDRERLLRTLMEGGGRGEMEAAMRHRSGDVRHSMITGAIVRLGGEPRLLAIARDVTETLAAKAALRDSQRSFMAAFHGSPNMIIINTFPEGRVIEVNEAAERLTGFRREELIGRTTLDLEVWGSIEDRQRMMAALESDGKIHDMEISFLTCSGEYRPAILSSSVIEFRGEPCLISTVQDISELKRAAEEREAFVHELEMKNEELERFTYTVSHDLKSPLVTIRGFLGFVEKAALARDEERLKQDLDRIRGATETMRRLLDELLELSRIGRQLNPPEDIDLCELVGEALSYLEEPIAERGIEVVVEDLPVVQGDRPRLLEVWQNLLENAVKFTRSAERPRMEVASRRDGDETVLYVRDNGDGIEPVYLEKIFGLFERLDPDVDGTGVGLALVKRIVEVHGGRVWAESEGPGAGTTFCLTLGSMTA